MSDEKEVMEDVGISWKEVLLSPLLFSMYVLNMQPFRYQAEFLEDDSKRIIVVASRQSGKTTMIAMKVIWEAFVKPKQTILIIAPTFRQSRIVFDRIREMIENNPILKKYLVKMTLAEIQFANGSKIHCLSAGREGSTIRGFSADIVVIDEAAFIPSEVWVAIEPSLAAKDGKLIVSGTPYGQIGRFWEIWKSSMHGRSPWRRYKIRAEECPLISKEFLEEMKRTLSRVEYLQEFEAEFVANTGLFFDLGKVMDCARDYEYKIPQKKKDGVIWVLGVDIARSGCHLERVEVLTPSGWKWIDELNEGDYIYVVNPENYEMSVGKVLRVRIEDYKGESYVYNGRFLDFRLTPNHKVLRETISGKKYIEEIANIKTGFMRRSVVWKGMRIDKFVNRYYKKQPNGGVVEYVNEWDMMDFVEFLGWYVSEGSYYGRRIIISQRDEEKRKQIMNLLDRMGIKYQIKKGGIEFWNKGLVEWVKENCYVRLDGDMGKAHYKKVPDIVKNLDVDYIERFLYSFALGDGHIYKDSRGVVFYTSSKQLADDLQELIVKVGRISSIRYKDEGREFEIEGRKAYRQSGVYVVYMYGGRNLVDTYELKKRMRREYYEGKMYGLTVSPHHFYIVRSRNGKIWISGNSDETIYMLVEVKEDINGDIERAKVLWVESEAKSNLVNVIGRIVDMAQSYPIDYVVVDETTMGAAVKDMLDEQLDSVIGITFSLKEKGEMYKNLKVLIEQKRLVLNRNDNKFLYQFMNIGYDYTVNGMLKIVCEEGHDDYIDALALALRYSKENVKVGVFDEINEWLDGGI